jgi:hypothetical protein
MEWYKKAHLLGELFVKNFKQYTDNELGKKLEKVGPQV